MSYTSGYFKEIAQESLSSAKIVVPLVLDLVRPSSVVDVGCATGAWLSIFRDHGVPRIAGLDGSYVQTSELLIPQDSFQVVDLAKPFSLPERYDLALSLEVAEHLPASSANDFVKSLCRCTTIILFSAAVPGQVGHHHVNSQWPEYWRRLFAVHNFRMFDPFRPVLMHEKRVARWYRQNMFLFIHNDVLLTTPRLSQLTEVKDGNELILIDADILFSLRATLSRLPGVIWTSVRRRAQRLFSRQASPNDSDPRDPEIAP